ncbi:relaxase/mobilization nuclease domain-containing protein [Streptomyces sp. NBC_00006]|uniref:relaxase/mobilization nuclease domain-containing protein n=1 Tax=Streptomyces sp. NBC_00006 TaxID=2975619 RepID=UPI0022556E7D|nr:mobilization protein [Streptomyces sp. NBC_00006]MCX5532334.1 relaxase/mobilization nuclease domain-containing protein [Streptomyces sp. NBC_00006]
MIAKITGGKSTAGLIRYLYDTKKATDHHDPHLVASWDGFAPDPGRSTDDPYATRKQLVADLDLHVQQAERLGRAPERHMWHCSIRAATTDRHLSDDDWADIARRVVAATSIAPAGDPDGCRWVAVRHADDHVHIAATTVRADLRLARHWNDYLTADRELAKVEREYGLFQVVRGDRTAAKRPTRAEQEKAKRAGQPSTTRERLRTTVRTTVAAARGTEEFLDLLAHTEGVQVDVKHFPSGDVRGYTVALTGDTNQAGEPIRFSGSELAPDLSFPKIKKRLDDLASHADGQMAARRTGPWHQATAATERIPHHLDGNADDEAAQAHINALGEALDTLPLIAPAPLRAQLHGASREFERAARSRIRADYQHARALRSAVRAILREPSPKDGAVLAMFLDAALLAVIAAARWHQSRHHDQQVAAAQRTQLDLQAAYDEAATAPLAALAQQRPPRPTVERHIRLVHDVVPEYAEKIVGDAAFDALAATFTQAEKAGHDPEQVLRTAVSRRSLADADRPARVLTWRIQRLAARQAPSARALAAQARSDHRTHVAPSPQVPSAAATPVPRPRRSR